MRCEWVLLGRGEMLAVYEGMIEIHSRGGVEGRK